MLRQVDGSFLARRFRYCIPVAYTASPNLRRSQIFIRGGDRLERASGPVGINISDVNVNEPQIFDVKENYIIWIVIFPCAISSARAAD
jgi:hypothetical protein